MMLFCLISTSIIHFVSPTIFPFASSPCTFPLTPWHLLFLSIFAFFHLQAFIFRWLHFSFLLSVPFPSDSSFSRHECLTTAFFLFCIYSSLSLSSSSCSCSVVSFRTGHYAECVPLQTLISRHYHPGPSQGAFSVSISV